MYAKYPKLNVILWAVVVTAVLACFPGGTIVHAQDGPLASVELSAGYAHSFTTGNDLAVGKASVELGEVTLFHRAFPVYADLIAVTGNSDFSVGFGLSTIIADNRLGFGLGVAYLPHGEGWAVTVNVLKINL